MGPHTFNFAEASRLAIEAGAALRAEDVDHGMRLALALLDQAAERASMAAAGKAFAKAHGGATEKRCACSTGWRTRIRMARAERWDRASLDLADPTPGSAPLTPVRHGSSEASANAAVNTAFAGTTCAAQGTLKVAMPLWPSARGTPGEGNQSGEASSRALMRCTSVSSSAPAAASSWSWASRVS